MKSELKLTGSTGTDDLGIKRNNYDASPNLKPGADDINKRNSSRTVSTERRELRSLARKYGAADSV